MTMTETEKADEEKRLPFAESPLEQGALFDHSDIEQLLYQDPHHALMGESARAAAAVGDVDAKKDVIHFPFPGTPYGIQEDFMSELYKTLERGGFGVFESPTGTVRDITQYQIFSPQYDILHIFKRALQTTLQNTLHQ